LFHECSPDEFLPPVLVIGSPRSLNADVDALLVIAEPPTESAQTLEVLLPVPVADRVIDEPADGHQLRPKISMPCTFGKDSELEKGRSLTGTVADLL
jgi:hypothetical protein